MNVTFEHPTIIFDDRIAEIIIEFVNHILYADSEKTLRQIVADLYARADSKYKREALEKAYVDVCNVHTECEWEKDDKLKQFLKSLA